MIIKVKIQPRAGKTESVGVLSDGTIKIKVAAPPEKSKANEELLKFLAAEYRVSKDEIKIISGRAGRHKIIKINSA